MSVEASLTRTMNEQASSTMLATSGRRQVTTVSDHWKPDRPAPSRIRVYDEEKLAMLLGDGSAPNAPSASMSRTRSLHGALRAQQRSEKKRTSREAEEQRVRRYERHRDEAAKRQTEAERAVREQLIEGASRRERKFNGLRSDIVEGHKLADEIQQHLTLQEMNTRTKLKRQFDEWNDGVYGAIQDQINDKLNAMDSADINRRRRCEFQKFLDTTNAKGAIFRDIIIESEYDPLEPNRNCIKVKTDGLYDPVKRVLDKHHEETSMLEDNADGGGDNGRGKAKAKTRRRPKPHVRETLDITSWGAGKIEATPHGYFAKLMDDSSKPDPEAKTTSKTFDSQIPFDHYNVPVGSAATAKEFPVGKRTMPVTSTLKLA